ncbi:zinc finger protein [Macleaya cordata]|uniref:Zinc finger protein n=1 Tax=Macleaya cordata TaxID=56857 RepID=A0A200QA83_MACCD|nr:zinc finger protein [Macleaya cordata]
MSGRRARGRGGRRGGRGARGNNDDVPTEEVNAPPTGVPPPPQQGGIGQGTGQNRTGGVNPQMPEWAVLRQMIAESVGAVVDARLDARLGARGPVAPAPVQAPVQVPQPPVVRVGAPTWMELHRHFLSLKPRTFGGSTDPLVAHQWIKEMEKTFRTFECPEEYKQRFAAFQLVEDALDWWESRSQDLDTTTLTWQQFQAMFFDQYFPQSARMAMEKEFQDLRQKDDQTVVEFEREFSRLALYAPGLIPTEQSKIQKFLRGLNRQISRHIIGQPSFDTFPKVVECARLHDQEIQEARRKRSEKAEAKPVDKRDQKNGQGQQGKNRDNRGYWKRQKTEEKDTGAVVPAQPETLRTEEGSRRVIKGPCYACGEIGHRAADCPRGNGVQGARQNQQPRQNGQGQARPQPAPNQERQPQGQPYGQHQGCGLDRTHLCFVDMLEHSVEGRELESMFVDLVFGDLLKFREDVELPLPFLSV